MAPLQYTDAQSERILAVADELARKAGVVALAERLALPVHALIELLTRRRRFRRFVVDRLATARGETGEELCMSSAEPSSLLELSSRRPNACECVWIARMSGVSEEALSRFIADAAASGEDKSTLEWTVHLRAILAEPAPDTSGIALPDGGRLSCLECARLDFGLRVFPERAHFVLEHCNVSTFTQLGDALRRWRETLVEHADHDDLAALEQQMIDYWMRVWEANAPVSLPAVVAPAMPMDVYAAVCAAIEVRPAEANAIFLAHGLGDPERRQAIRDSWTSRFDTYPHERAVFEHLFAAALENERGRS